jgi:hypothetical protein
MWPAVFRELVAAGIAFEAIGRLTLPQVIHLLDLEPTSINSVIQDRIAILDQICRENRWLSSHLRDLPLSDLEAHIQNRNGGEVDRATLQRSVAEFVRMKRNGD